MTYRMRIPASVCVSVSAENEADAVQQIHELVWASEGGLSVVLESPLDARSLDARCYLHSCLPADEIAVAWSW